MFLGIKYNTWHLILTFFGFGIFFLSPFAFLHKDVNQVNYFYYLGMSVLILMHLHLWNEYFQAMDRQVSKKYGSYIRFQKDSKLDWKNMLIGLFTGMIFWTIVLKLLF